MSDSVSVAAVVTTFNPDNSLLANLRRISDQVGLLILVDDSGPVNELEKVDYSGIGNLIYIKNEINTGIAASLNRGVLRAAEAGYSWVITLDDDTLVSKTYVSDIFDFINSKQLPNVGLVACSRGCEASEKISTEGFSVKRNLITSGSVFSIDLFNRVGGFDEGLFIDLVDFDFCARTRKLGRKVVVLNKRGMEHKVGNSVKVDWYFMNFIVYNHAPFRLYYQMRNIFMFLKKHFAFDPLLSTYIFLDVFRLPLKALFFEGAKLERFKYLGLGLLDGLMGRGGRMRIDLN